MKNFILRKLIASLLIAVSVLAINPGGASAEWKHDRAGWWYADGSSWYTGWKKIDRKWYYFESNGYMVHDRYVNGYYLNSEGYWDIYALPPTVSPTLQGVSVKYPSSWEKTTTENGLTGYYLDDQGTNVIVATLSMQDRTSKDYLDANIRGIKKILGIEQVNTSTQIINGRTVDVLDYEYIESNLLVKLHQVIFYNNNKAYIFSLTRGSDISSADIMNSFNDMLKTVTLL